MPPAGSSSCTWQLQKHRSAKSSWHGREAQHCHSDRLGPIARGPTLAMDIRKQPIDYAGFTPGVVPYLCAIVLYMLSTHQRMTHLQTFPFQRVLQDQAAWGNQTLVEEAAAAAAQAHAAAARLASSHARSAADKDPARCNKRRLLRSCNAETFRGVGPSHTATSLWLAQSGNPGYPAGCLMSPGYWRSEVGPRVTMWWLCLCWPIDLHIWF